MFLLRTKNKFCLLFVLTVLMNWYYGQESSINTIKTIVIDAGHGGKDPGTNGLLYKEKDISLAVALKLEELFKKYMPEVKVILTRRTDEFVELEERAQIANKNKADLFISIHCNAAGKPVMIKDPKTGKLVPKKIKNSKGKYVIVETANPEPFGSETYVMGLKNEKGKMSVAMRENAPILLEDNYKQKYQGFDPESEESYIIMSNYTSAYVIQSAKLAMKIQEEYKTKAGRIDKGVHRQSIWVLWRTSMPSVLTEIGYLTNPNEEKFLGSEIGQKYIAATIFNAVRKYKAEVEGKKMNFDDEIENLPPLQNENLVQGILPKNGNGEEVVENTFKKDSTQTDAISIKKDTTQRDANEVISDEIIFRVQIKVSDKPIEIKNEKPLENVWFYMSGSLIKYTSGKFSTLEEAQKHLFELKNNGYKDAFIVAFKGIERISIEEAKKILQSKQ
ncbi:MAG: N-acetylmuramoyl-L-alanine amidase [Bacteroidia bacterium]|nr:MAG: N-acetylmuramoyl-L-alanine amidase [Bacteroidia bacterium]